MVVEVKELMLDIKMNECISNYIFCLGDGKD